MTNPPSLVSLPDLRRIWPQVVAKVQPASARMSLLNGQVHTADATTLTLRFSSNFHREKASTPEGLRSAHDALAELTGHALKIMTILDSDIVTPPPSPPPANHVDLASAVSDIF